MSIKNIIFDMGNVLLKFSPNDLLDKEGIIKEEERKLLLEKVFHSPEWTGLDDGSLREADFFEIKKSEVPVHLHEAFNRLLFKWDDPIVPVEGMESLIKELKEMGYKIYLLSNASFRQKEYWNRVPGCQYFDGTVVSADINMIKPNSEIFHHILEKFNIKPEETIFIDDMKPNVEAAQKLGINTFHFNDNYNELRNFILNFNSK